MVKDGFLLAVGLCSSVLGYGQVPPVSQTSAATSAPQQAAKATAHVNFHSDLLDLSFTYPESLVAEKLPSLDEQHAALARRYGPDEEPEYRKQDQCTDRALIARRKDQPSTPGGSVTVEGTIYGDKRGIVLDAHHAVTAKILISRVGVECMPAEAQRQLDDVAAVMAEGLTKEEGLKPIDQPIWYEVGKTRIHFAAAQNAPEVEKPVAKSGDERERRWVASMAFVWRGNLVSVFVESNDLPFLNEVLHGQITLGKEPAAPLFPAGIGGGKPLQPKP
jgi:hypothetical protein